MELRVCGIEPGKPLNFTTGAQIVPTYGLDACADADLVAIPAGRLAADYPDEVLEVLRAADRRGAYILVGLHRRIRARRRRTPRREVRHHPLEVRRRR